MKSPAFQFYPADYLADAKVKAMTLEERGAYVELLSLQWLENFLPSDLSRLAKLIGVTPAKMGKLWPGLAPCFVRDGERIYQPRLEKERLKQQANREKKQRAADARWYPEADQSPSTRNAPALQTACSSSSSSSSTTNTHTHSRARESSPASFVPPAPPIVPSPEVPTLADTNRGKEYPDGWVDHFAPRLYWRRFGIEMNLDTQQRMAAAVSDEQLWIEVLDYWEDGKYRQQSVGRIVSKYRELKAERNGKPDGRIETTGGGHPAQAGRGGATRAERTEERLRNRDYEALAKDS